MAHSDHYLPLYDKDGSLRAVQLSPELWERGRRTLEPLVLRLLEEMEPTERPERPEPIDEWDELKKYWDFKYPYCADVQCGNCGAQTADWLSDPGKPFVLRGADFGGLAVFTCKSCGATVRKKHFKDHVCFEFSTDSCGC